MPFRQQDGPRAIAHMLGHSNHACWTCLSSQFPGRCLIHGWLDCLGTLGIDPVSWETSHSLACLCGNVPILVHLLRWGHFPCVWTSHETIGIEWATHRLRFTISRFHWDVYWLMKGMGVDQDLQCKCLIFFSTDMPIIAPPFFSF